MFAVATYLFENIILNVKFSSQDQTRLVNENFKYKIRRGSRKIWINAIFKLFLNYRSRSGVLHENYEDVIC
jgi:hypothetical protein